MKPISGIVSCNSRMSLYADGEHIYTNWNWKIASYVEVPWYTEVVAIKVSSHQYVIILIKVALK